MAKCPRHELIPNDGGCNLCDAHTRIADRDAEIKKLQDAGEALDLRWHERYSDVADDLMTARHAMDEMGVRTHYDNGKPVDDVSLRLQFMVEEAKARVARIKELQARVKELVDNGNDVEDEIL